MGEEFIVDCLQTDEDVEQHLELMRRVFGEEERIDLLVRKWIEHHPQMTLKDFLVARHNGKIVAGLNLIPLKWSLEGISIKVAELGCVATLPQYRRLGLQKRLMNEYHKRVAQEDYDLSAIEGIPHFYRQFGYEYSLPLSEETRVDVEQIPNYESRYKIHPFEKRDITKAMHLLAVAQQKFGVHSVRDKNLWMMQQDTGMMAERKFESYCVEDNGDIVAYFRISDNQQNKELTLREITNVSQHVAQAVLKFLRNIAEKRMLKTIAATVSSKEYFAQHMLAVSGAIQNQPYAWQIRFTDHVKLFKKMKLLFEKRLAVSAYADLTEKLNFNFYRYTAQLSVENGKITNVQQLDTCEDTAMMLNSLAFTQLLFGYRSREELQTIYPDFIIRQSYKPLIDVLFPKMSAYIHTDY